MANTITGRILLISQTEAIPYQDSVFYKRELVLDASRFDQFSGQKFENYPKFEFTGNNCALLDNFQIGQAVTVSFVLSGRRKESNGQVSYFTNVTGYKVEPYMRQPQQVEKQMPPQQAQHVPAQPAMQSQPQHVSQQAQVAGQPFPPAVDENGNPMGGDDLPF